MATAKIYPALESLKKEFEFEPKSSKGVQKWGLGSRKLIIHLFANILGEKFRMPKDDKLPSCDAKTMDKFKGSVAFELGARISAHRSAERSLSSFKNATKFIYPAANGLCHKALIGYRPLGFDNVERIFTKAEESIPLNLDKQARKAFLSSVHRIAKEEILAAIPNFADYLPANELAEFEAQDSVPAEMWVSFDWAQAELYKLCLFSQDDRLFEALTGSDFHRYVAHVCFDVAFDDVTPAQREDAKTLTFALVYSSFDLNVAAAIAIKRNKNLNASFLESALIRYLETFHKLHTWVKTTQMQWATSGHCKVSYAFHAPKKVQMAEYQKLESIGTSEAGRVAINTFGQNSVGLLFKKFLQGFRKHEVVRAHTTSYIPVFDALYFRVDTLKIAEVMDLLLKEAAPTLVLDRPPVLEGQENFSIQMKADFSASLFSWGTCGKIKPPRQVADGTSPVYYI